MLGIHHTSYIDMQRRFPALNDRLDVAIYNVGHSLGSINQA